MEFKRGLGLMLRGEVRVGTRTYTVFPSETGETGVVFRVDGRGIMLSPWTRWPPAKCRITVSDGRSWYVSDTAKLPPDIAVPVEAALADLESHFGPWPANPPPPPPKPERERRPPKPWDDNPRRIRADWLADGYKHCFWDPGPAALPRTLCVYTTPGHERQPVGLLRVEREAPRSRYVLVTLMSARMVEFLSDGRRAAAAWRLTDVDAVLRRLARGQRKSREFQPPDQGLRVAIETFRNRWYQPPPTRASSQRISVVSGGLPTLGKRR